jgi:hypothetical protein
MPRRKNTTSTPVTSHKHKDKRANIPTEELREFVADDERKPKTVLCPRDPSIDPQLLWKGKDEQDQQALAMQAVNNHGGFGRWAFLEIANPWEAKNVIRTALRNNPSNSCFNEINI